jgi:hypothetical protein
MRSLTPRRMPQPGDWFISGLQKLPVAGYAPDTKSLMYYRTYADRHDPKEVPMKDLKKLDSDWTPIYWIAKTRTKLRFNVDFLWAGGTQHFSTQAVSMKQARLFVLQQIGVRLCNVDPALRSVVTDHAKKGLADAAGQPYSPDLLQISIDLKN